MLIESIRRKALRRFFEAGDPRGLDGALRTRLNRMLVFLKNADGAEDLAVPPNFGAHPLTGDRAGYWSLKLTANWRMTFVINDKGAIADLDLEDYH